MLRVTNPYEAGDIVRGRYELEHDIGAGGMGSLYKALDKRVSKRVAIKFLSPALVSDKTVMKRFEREAHALGRIRHDHVCYVSDYGVTDENIPFIVMELLEGLPLADVLDRENRLPPRRAINIMIEVLSALGAVHQLGIIHRDLKPDNIFMVRTSLGKPRAKLIDFGIAKFLDATSPMTTEGATIGTPFYMSPEQVSGHSKKIDQRTDIWAVGVILYECLVGAPPFKGGSPAELFANILFNAPPPMRELNPALPLSLEKAILKSLEKKSELRYQDTADFAAALADLEGEYEGDPVKGSDITANDPAFFDSVTRQAPSTAPSGPITDGSASPTDIDPFSETGASAPTIERESIAGIDVPPSSDFPSTLRDEAEETAIPAQAVESIDSQRPTSTLSWRLLLIVIVGLAAIGGGAGAAIHLFSARSELADSPNTAPEPAPRADDRPLEPEQTNLADQIDDVEGTPEKTVGVQIRTTPSDAEVYLDGKGIANPFDGNLPFATEPRSLEARLAGYRTVIQDLSLRDEQQVRIELREGRGIDDRRRKSSNRSKTGNAKRRPIKRTDPAVAEGSSQPSSPGAQAEPRSQPTDPAPAPAKVAEPVEDPERAARRGELKNVGLQ